jgi:hypothetical protein
MAKALLSHRNSVLAGLVTFFFFASSQTRPLAGPPLLAPVQEALAERGCLPAPGHNMLSSPQLHEPEIVE